MKELSNLLGFRESIKVVDATLRDGGLVNDFYFTDAVSYTHLTLPTKA